MTPLHTAIAIGIPLAFACFFFTLTCQRWVAGAETDQGQNARNLVLPATMIAIISAIFFGGVPHPEALVVTANLAMMAGCFWLDFVVPSLEFRRRLADIRAGRYDTEPPVEAS